MPFIYDEPVGGSGTPIYDVPVDSSGTPILVGNLVYESTAWDVRMVLTAGTQWNALFDAIAFICDQCSMQADGMLHVYTGYSRAFDGRISIHSLTHFDACYDIAVGTIFDAKFGIGDSTLADAAFGIGRASDNVFDASMRVWDFGKKATLYGYFLRPDGTPLSGVGTLRISAPARLAGSSIMPAPVPVNVGTDGFFSLMLHPNADLDPPTTVYLLTLGKWTLVFRVPRIGSVWLHELHYLRLSDPIFFQDVITAMTSEGRKSYIIVRIGTRIFRLPAEPI